MKQGSLSKETSRGTSSERKLFREKITNYELSKADLDIRIPDWDKKDELFRSFIDESKWPYQSVVFDPRVFTAIFEKTARLMANKPRGRMVPREGGDAIGAKINNELLSFQWDENERVDATPMLAKWAMMDQNCRKYGASFALVKWQHQTYKKKGKDGKYKSATFYDGPDFKPLINRDVLANPSYSSVKGWFQYREYVTLKELEYINDSARTEAVYKNLDLLRDAVDQDKAKGGDTRQSNWTSKNKSIKGLEDNLGMDTNNKTIEVVTEYTNERWVAFAPKHGVVLRDIANPMDHGQIPVVQLKYYPVDDDLYGLSEIEPVERLQRAINALLNQYLDNINISLYTPLKIRATGVQMHTIEFGPGKKWIMNDPTTDVVPFQTAGQGVQEFASTYRFLVSAMQEALGETSQGVSNITGGPDKTATEIKSSDVQRNARDSYNQMFLSEALKKQMLFWHTMDRQFLFSDPSAQQKVIRIIGKDALRYFQMAGLDKESLQEEEAGMLAEADTPDLSEQFMKPNFPVDLEGMTVPKMTMDDTGEMGTLILEPDDLSGEYDYIPDVESMSLPSDESTIAAQRSMVEAAASPEHAQALAMEGYKIKLKELEEDYYEKLGMKDADKYYEKLPQAPAQPGMPQGGLNAVNPAAGVSPEGQPGVQGIMPDPGMAQAPQMA